MMAPTTNWGISTEQRLMLSDSAKTAAGVDLGQIADDGGRCGEPVCRSDAGWGRVEGGEQPSVA
jgi:hypothetical protein